METGQNAPHRASCHCGRVAIEVSGRIDSAMSCNCSMCQRRGSLLWFVPRAQMTLLTGADSTARYTFHKHVIQHFFCPDCGIHVFGEANDPDGSPRAAINVRCIEDVDLAAVPVTHFDGRAM